MLASIIGMGLLGEPKMIGQEFPQISPAELQMTSEPLAPGAPAVILQRRVDRNDELAQQNDYVRIKVLTEAGRKYGDVQIPFYRGVINIRNIQGRTIQPNGSISNFNGQVYERELVKGRGWRYLAKIFTLPDVQAGSIVEYSYTLDLNGSFYGSHWILSDELFTKHAQFTLTPVHSTRWPMSMRWSWKDLPAGSEPVQGADRVIRMEANNIPAFQAEDYMPPENELKARVDFVYQWDFGESDPDKFWKRVGKIRHEGLEKYLAKSKAMQKAVENIVSPSDPPEIKLRKIYARVQELRNTSYALERTAKEEKRSKEKQAENVEDIWKHGYGNSTELPWLFLGLVRAAGFEAYGCWVADRSEYFFNPKMLDSEALRDNVVLVKVNGKDMYFDPGSAFAPFGYLPWSETATPGLRLDNNGGTWIRTPLPDSADSQIQRTARFKLSESGDLEGTVSVTFTGLEAMLLRAELRNADEVGRKNFLEQLTKAEVPVSAEVELTKKPDWKSTEAPFIAEFGVKVPNWASSAGRRLLLPIGIFGAGEKHMFEHAERRHPIYFAYPYAEVDDVTVELPLQWQVSAIPEARTQTGYDTSYKTSVTEDSKGVHITRQLNVGILMLEKDRYPGLRNLFQAVRAGDEDQVVLQRVKE